MKIFQQINATPSTHPLKFSLETARFLKKYFYVSAITVIILNLIWGVFPYFSKLFFDSLSQPNIQQTYTAAFVMLAAIFLAHLFNAIYDIVATKLWGLTKYQARKDILSYIAKHPHGFYSNHASGKLGAQVMETARSTELAFFYLQHFGPLCINLGASFFIAINTNGYFGFAMVLWSILIALYANAKIRRIGNLARKSQKLNNDLFGKIVDFISNISLVKYFGIYPLELSKLKAFATKQANVKANRWLARRYLDIFMDFADIVFRFSIMLASTFLYFQNVFTIGDIVMFLIIADKIERHVHGILLRYNDYIEKYKVTQESLENLVTPLSNQDSPSAKDILISKVPTIKLTKLNFSYGSIQDIKNFSLDIPAGQKLGVVGHSGAGKSTFFKLLMRLYQVGNKQIFINDHDINSFTKESFRKNLAVVDQETLMFNRTIKENITLGRKVSKKELQKVLKDSHCLEFIHKLPEGLETKVGERGVKLSGGQRQRVGIARAMLKGAPILLLDEATSALDSESEKCVQDSLHKLSKGKTVIAIAHRLSTLLEMDRIIVMHKGQIVEDGTHQQLLQKNGIYAELWAHQQSGFLTD
jgi:ATP-binding cassette, subfamily B, bacterial